QIHELVYHDFVSPRNEQFALDHFVNQRPHAAALPLRVGDDERKVLAVCKRNIASGTVDRELPGQVFEQASTVRGQKVLKLCDPLERSSVGQFTAGVHVGA